MKTLKKKFLLKKQNEVGLKKKKYFKFIIPCFILFLFLLYFVLFVTNITHIILFSMEISNNKNLHDLLFFLFLPFVGNWKLITKKQKTNIFVCFHCILFFLSHYLFEVTYLFIYLFISAITDLISWLLTGSHCPSS